MTGNVFRGDCSNASRCGDFASKFMVRDFGSGDGLYLLNTLGSFWELVEFLLYKKIYILDIRIYFTFTKFRLKNETRPYFHISQSLSKQTE